MSTWRLYLLLAAVLGAHSGHSVEAADAGAAGEHEHEHEHDLHDARHDHRATTIPAAIAEAAGVRTDVVGPATIRAHVSMMGTVVIDANRVARVGARFRGIVHDVQVRLGETVERGQVMAVIEANDSMRPYTVTAPIKGTVTRRNTNAGAIAGDAPLFEISDLGEVWVDLHAFGGDLERLAPGQPVRISQALGSAVAEARIDRVLPLVAADSQSAIARVRLPNPAGAWRPGTAVNAVATVAEETVPLAVRRSGVQRSRGATVVYVRLGDSYEERVVELGRRDEQFAEVLAGLAAGTQYVSEQSFLIRADIEKAGVGHDH